MESLLAFTFVIIVFGTLVAVGVRAELDYRRSQRREGPSLKARAGTAVKAADAGMVKLLGAGLRSARAYAKRIEDEAGKQC
jgi:hypothetical protein